MYVTKIKGYPKDQFAVECGEGLQENNIQHAEKIDVVVTFTQ